MSEEKQNIAPQPEDGASLKLRTARTLKWHTIDKLSSQVLYALTGIVLANLLPKEDFGLVGVLLVFQAFAILFVDSGFGSALLQKKHPSNRDYSTVFWFNFAVSIAVYILLWFATPSIADIFQGDERLIPLSRVMFLSFIINGLGIVQTNRLMKRMDVKQLAVSNLVGLTVSGCAGITLALKGYGAWALVWQTVILAVVKTSWLWIVEKWLPREGFSLASLRKIYRVGMGVFVSQFLNTLFLNIYPFIIGARYSMTALGDYTQADKWSKMGSASVSQILTASFVPLLSKFQDNREKFHSMIRRINAFTAFLLFPAMGGLVVLAEPLFHSLFDTKWDSAIVLFQILLLRGIFTVLTSLYNNYILALGHARSIVIVEVVKDAATIIAILLTVGSGSIDTLVWGQLAAGGVTWLFVLWLTARSTGYRPVRFISDMLPYLGLTAAVMAVMWWILTIPLPPAVSLLAGAAAGLALYSAVMHFANNKIYREATQYLFGRFRRKHCNTTE